MKKSAAVLFILAVSMIFAAQPAMARTNVSVCIGQPGFSIEASNYRPSVHHVWADGYRHWNGRTHVWVPGHWRYAPRAAHVRTYARHQPRHDQYSDRFRDRDRRYDQDEDRRWTRD